MSDAEDQARSYELYISKLAEIDKLRNSNYENFDKAIITLGSFGLTLSLSFLKDFLPIERADYGWTLYASWLCFCVSVFLTLCSFLLSDIAHRQSAKILRKIIIEAESLSDSEKRPSASTYLDIAMVASGIFFAMALVLTAVFVGLNLTNASKYKEGFCRDKNNVFVECKRLTASAEPAGISPPASSAVIPEKASQSLNNNVTIMIGQQKKESDLQGATPVSGSQNAPTQSLQNTVSISLPPIASVRVRKPAVKDPCEPCRNSQNQ